jgi:hypothetical protein
MTIYKVLSAFGLLLIPLAFTQAQESQVIPENADLAAELLEVVPTVTEKWYRSEQISGDPEVGDFVVGPGRAELNVKPGETVYTEISVTNRISEARDFRLEIEDITGSADGSSALTIVEDAEGPYSIRDYISFPEEIITLGLGERVWIPVEINVPKNVDPGGLYGTILVSTIQKSDSNKLDNAPRNPIIARVGSHIFLNIEGDSVVVGEAVGINVLPTALWYESGPFNFGISFENAGSVHLNPYGELSVKNFLGQDVGYVEMDPWFVLPTSLRTREITWNREFLFGRYTATAKINRGYDDIVDEVEVSFWVLPWKLLLTVFTVIFGLLFLFRLFFRTFEFKRK